MYSVGRRLLQLPGSGKCLKHLCMESKIKYVRMTVSSGRRFLCCSSGGSVPFSSQMDSKEEGNFSRNLITSRCYSQSVEKADAKGEDGGRVEQEDNNDSRAADEEAQEEYDYEEEEGIFLTDEQIQELTQGDPELVKKIKYIQLEYSVMRQDGEQIPSLVKFKYWRELIQLDSRSRRKKFYVYLFKTEMKQMNQMRRKEEERTERLKLYAENPMPNKEDDPYGMFYGLTRNTLFLRLYDTTVTKHENCNVARAMQLHPPLILDCSYDEFMTRREAKNCAKQIELLITDNRRHPEPFNLYICNLRSGTNTEDYMNRLMPTMRDDGYAVNVHEESYLDLFPKKRLVYLTPHTRDELEEYNEDDIYIIGAMVDKSVTKPYSLAKAKKLGLTMKRLPLDQHLMWGLGGKSLTINQMVNIMLDIRYSRGDWKAALKHVPMRKLCRTFHPYPDDERNNEGYSENDNNGPPLIQPYRKERKSMVMEDYELANRRKGFRRSDNFRSSQAIQAPRIRSLYQDDNN